MAKTLDSLIVLRGQPGCENPVVLAGQECRVRIYDEPEAEEQTFSRVDLATMKSSPASDIIERKQGAIELHAPYHSFAWGVKINGRPQGRWSGKHIRIAKVGDAAEIRETHAAMIAAIRWHREAKVAAWNNAKPTTAAAAKRLATDWPEVKLTKVGEEPGA
jgi:hypothetical protein